MNSDTVELMRRAEVAYDLFVQTKLTPEERTLCRPSHRISFCAGFVMAVMQERFPDKKKEGA